MKNIKKDVWISNQFNCTNEKINILDEKLEENLGEIYIEKISEDMYSLEINRNDLYEPVHVIYNTNKSELNKIIKDIALDLKFC